MSNIKEKTYRVALGGIDDRVLPDAGTARNVVNMEWSPGGYWQVGPGAVMVSALAEGSGEISAMRWFQPRPNQRWLVFERRIDASTSRISYVNLITGGSELIVDRRRVDSVTQGTQFLESGRWLYILSPVDRLVRWDGKKVVPVGFSSRAPALRVSARRQGFTEVDRAAAVWDAGEVVSRDRVKQRGVGEFPDAADEPWTYGYGFTQMNDLGQESPMSDVVFVSEENEDLPAFGKFLVRLSAAQSPDGVMAVRVWRTRNLLGVTNPDQGVSLYLHSTVHHGGAWDDIDHKPDSELGPLYIPEETGPVPFGARAMAFFGGSMWLAGMPDDDRVRYSAPLFPEQFPANNYLVAGSSAQGPVVALHPIGRALLVFRTGGIWMVKGSHAEGWRADEIDTSKGCAAPNGIVTVPNVGVMFLDRSGPHVIAGTLDDDQPTQVRPLHGGIRRLWRERVGLNLESASVSYDVAEDRVWWQVPEGGEARPDLSLILNTVTGMWSVWNGWRVGAQTVYAGRVWVGSWDDEDYPGIYVVTRGSRERFGDVVEGTYTTNPLQNSVGAWQPMWVDLQGLALGNDLWTLEIRSDVSPSFVNQSDGALRQRQPMHDRDVWGKARWDAGDFTEYELAKIPVSVRVPMSYTHSLRVTSKRLRLSQIVLDLPAGGGPAHPRTPER